MVLRGNICFSGFYSDDFHVRGAERHESLSKNLLTHRQIFESWQVLAAQPANTARHKKYIYIYIIYKYIHIQVFCKKKEERINKSRIIYEFTILLLVTISVLLE